MSQTAETEVTETEVTETPAADPFYMAGTERTGKYVVVATKGSGADAIRVGVRNFAPGEYRVRVEVGGKFAGIAKVLTREVGWKQPGDSGQQRFSKVVTETSLGEAVAQALKACGLSLNPMLVAAGAQAAKEVSFPAPPAPAPDPKEAALTQAVNGLVAAILDVTS